MFPSGLRIQLLVLLLKLSCCTLSVSFIEYPSANFSASSSWLNHPTLSNSGYWKFSDGTHVRTILATGKNGSPDFCLGFFNNGVANTFYLALLKLPFINASDFPTAGDYYEFQFPPIVLWSANRNNPIGENSTLELSSHSLVLKYANGTTVWNTRTMVSVERMELVSGGNLRLISNTNTLMWESFLYPTNIWLPGQNLRLQQGLISSKSEHNLTDGWFSVRVLNGAIRAFVTEVVPQQYRSIFEFDKDKNYSDFGIMALVYSAGSITYKAYSEDFQYLRLEPNGHLNLFRFDGYNGILYSDLLEDKTYASCGYPMVCGRKSVCNRGKCTCVGEVRGRSEFFSRVNATDPSLGCKRVYSYSCKDDTLHTTFLALENTTYFTFNVSLSTVSAETCKGACLKPCYCKGFLFRYRDDIMRGNCSFLLDVFTLTDVASFAEELNYNSIAYIKVQKKKRESVSVPGPVILIPSIAGCSLLLIICLGSFYYFRVWRNRRSSNDKKDESYVQVSTLVKEFTFQDLSAATKNFGQKIGEGGFGCVYEGTLKNGTKIAVKRLNHLGKKEFLTEVKTIGSIHHFNLVKLIGYCAGRSMRFLVYEYVRNGSLDKWIFKSNATQYLSWETRKGIITGIANGLEYLHVGCNPNIIHFDIKPQNILLDQEFNVKIADFGLAKWINRGERNISAMPKGTPGYIAPELFAGRKASVKVDVYSFGIVILEIVCGRKCSSMHHENGYLIDEVRQKAEEGRLLDLIDIYANGDLQCHGEEAVKFLEVAIRCLQAYNRRPSMPSVLKLLEGSLDIEPLSDFSSLRDLNNAGFVNVVGCGASTPPVDSLLSGPR